MNESVELEQFEYLGTLEFVKWKRDLSTVDYVRAIRGSNLGSGFLCRP